MRKNFLKKLSFVMALAMIVSVIAPAAGVFAAADLSLNKADKTLHLSGEPGSNKYNFNINGEKAKGWKYLWTSSNEDVAVVNETNGVTEATGLGKATITVVITDKKGAEVDTLSAKVTVKDNIKTVKIANVPDKAIAVNKVYDFNRSFVTLSGVTETTGKTSAITRWAVEGDNSAKATINDENGEFIATEAGKYTVVARSFQSKAKYEEWKVSKADTLVLAKDSAEVTVAASIVGVKQDTVRKFTVEFDTDMSKSDLSDKTAKVYQVINGTPYETGTEKIKEIKINGNKATVELFADFRQETEYKFVYGDLADTFKSAKVDINEVKSLRFDDFDVSIDGDGVDMHEKVAGLNAAGVEIYSPSANGPLTTYVSFGYEGDQTKGFLSGDKLYIYTEGFTANVVATFENYVFNDTTKAFEPIKFTDNAVAKGVKIDTNVNTSTMQFAVVKSGSGNPDDNNGAWTAAKTVPANDGDYVIYTRYKKNNESNPWNAYIHSYDAGSVAFTYEATNTDKLLISGNSIYPIAQGTVTVLVKNSDNKVIGSFDLLIQGDRKYTAQTLDKNYISVGNNSDYGETASVKVTSKDSMNEFIPAASIAIGSYSWDRKPATDAVLPSVSIAATPQWNDASQISISVNGKDATKGAYVLKLPLTAYGATKDVFVTVQVLDGNEDKTVVSWRVELGTDTVDLKDNAKQNVSIDVYGYNNKNVRVAKLADDQYSVEVKKSNGQSADNYTTVSIAAVRPVSGAGVETYAVDSYVVTAKVVSGGSTHPTKKATGTVIQSVQLTVKDSSVKDKKVVSTVVAPGTVLDMTKAALDFKLNNDNFTAGDGVDANLYSVKYTFGASGLQDATADANPSVSSGSSLRIDSVTFRVAKSVDGVTTYIFYKIPVGVTVKAE